MKKSMMISVLVLCFAAVIPGSFAVGMNRATPRDKGMTALHRQFPSATNIAWYGNGNSFTAYYLLRGEKAISHFSKDGNLMFTLIYRKTNELPVNIYERICSRYRGFEVRNVEEYLGTDAHYYAVLLENKTALIRLRAAYGNSMMSIIQKLNKG